MKDPMLGLQLANFRIDRLLGQGGMAMVYYGEDIKLHRPVAIKVLDKRYKNHPSYAARFVNEARMMAKWHHENIIQIYYADDAQGFPYYVMEYVDGQDLDAVLNLYKEEGKLMPIADVLRIGRAVADALDYAHRHGIIHRDVKPSNILLSKDGRVLLGDFGMALDVRDGSQGIAFGTPHYISPEQAKHSADAVPQSDTYSLGVILFEILTGSAPFNDDLPEEIALKHISQPPPAPRSINPELSAHVEAVLLKALQKSPKERYQSAIKLMTALEDALKPGGAEKKIPLPPLPVGAPTIQRSEFSIEQISKRPAPKPVAPQPKPIAKMPATVRSSNTFRKRGWWVLAALLILLLGFAGFFYLKNLNGIPALDLVETSTLPPLPAATLVPPTETQLPSPEPVSATLAPIETIAPTATFTLEPSPTIDVNVTPTVKYPEGNQYTLFYNETSFFMLNRSYGYRSISGFTFQRLDLDGLPAEDIFPGYQWQTQDFDYLPRNFCVNITIYGDQEPPYLNPADCRIGLLTTIQPRFDRPGEVLFWTPKEDSLQFRVIWLEEEVARCDIAAGICEVYIP